MAIDYTSPILIAIIISMAEYASKSLNLRKKEYFAKVISFSAGVSITYLLLELFPFFSGAALVISNFLFFSILIGFVSHHIVEKQIYQHNRSHELVRLLNLEEHSFYYVYHTIIGIILFIFMNYNVLEGYLFAISILAYTVVSNLPVSPHKSHRRMIILSTSTVVGTLIGAVSWNLMPEWFEFSLIGLVIGVLLFTVTRHHIPYKRKGSVGAFVLGSVFYGTLIVIKWFI